VELESRAVVVYDVEDLTNDFYRTLGQVGCMASITIPDAVITTAIMNQVLGYSPFRGTATMRVMEELTVFGVPPLVAEDLFAQLCAKVKAHIYRVLRREVFQTDFYWKFVDNQTTVLIVER